MHSTSEATRSTFQSTHPVWGATRGLFLSTSNVSISIHAPRVGCDGLESRRLSPPIPISIHAPRVGCDLHSQVVKAINEQFQSTHPVWGATKSTCRHLFLSPYFNPRTPCGVRRSSMLADMGSGKISIHAPRVGCDIGSTRNGFWGVNFNPRTPCGVRQVLLRDCPGRLLFQSTHPVWGATVYCCGKVVLA